MNSGREKFWTNLATYAALVVICALAMIPLLWMVSTSLKSDAQIVQSPPRWMPDQLVWNNYRLAISSEWAHSNFGARSMRCPACPVNRAPVG